MTQEIGTIAPSLRGSRSRQARILHERPRVFVRTGFYPHPNPLPEGEGEEGAPS